MGKLGNFVARVACVAGAVVVVVVVVVFIIKAKGEISRTRAHTRELISPFFVGYPQCYFHGLPISHVIVTPPSCTCVHVCHTGLLYGGGFTQLFGFRPVHTNLDIFQPANFYPRFYSTCERGLKVMLYETIRNDDS